MLDPDVTDEMQKAGNDLADRLVNASIAKSLDGLGGSQTWEQWLSAEMPNRDLVPAYLEDRIDSVTALYLAMSRAREN